jgi:class 3 adenylate cyclase
MTGLRDLKTQTRLSLILIVIVLVGALVIAWSTVNTLALQARVHRIEQEAQELARSAEAQGTFLEQQLALKNLLLSGGDPWYQSLYRRYDRQLQDYLRQALIVADTIDKREDLNQIGAGLRSFTATVNTTAPELVPDELDASGMPASLEHHLTLVDAEAFRVQEHLKNTMLKRSLGLQALVADIDRQVQRTAIAGIVALVLFSALTIVALHVINQIAEPILHLTNAVVAFEANVYSSDLLAAYKRNQDELGELALALDAMAGSITESVQLKDRFLKSAQRFVPHQYLEFLQKDSIIDVRLGDHVSAEMAVMFSDVRGFTTMSENMTPQENFDFVNAYLQLVSPVIEKHHGFIVKFLGDGMMAIFPYGVDDAVRAGLEKQQRVTEFNVELAKRGLQAIEVGIGIHTGHMMVGMIGDEMRIQGDAFSDNVNLTARIEGLTKFYGASMIITEETLMRLERPVPYAMRHLGLAQVKGREMPISLYEILEGETNGNGHIKQNTKEQYERGLRYYMSARFIDAKAELEAVLQQNPEDRVAQLYLERATAMIGQAVPDAWQGIEVMTSK